MNPFGTCADDIRGKFLKYPRARLHSIQMLVAFEFFDENETCFHTKSLTLPTITTLRVMNQCRQIIIIQGPRFLATVYVCIRFLTLRL